MFQMIWKYLKQLHRDFRASVAKTFRASEVVKVLSLSHNQELAKTPIELWPITKLRHQEQVKAVMAGRFDEIVDRRSWALPMLPEAIHRLNQPVLKASPWNLIRFGETPIARRAINLIKNSILSLKWEIKPTKEADADNPEMEMRIDIGTNTLKHPNNTESFRSCFESMIEDYIVGGYGVLEPRMTPLFKRPFKLFSVMGCYSEDTEVLTKRGWVLWPKVNKDDLFATRSSKGILEYQQAIKLQKFYFDDYLLNFKTPGVNLLVTPNHRMVGRQVWIGNWRKKEGSYRYGEEKVLLAEDVAKLSRYAGGEYRFQIPLGCVEWKGQIHKAVKNGKVPIRIKEWKAPTGISGKKGFQPATFISKVYWIDLNDWVSFMGLYTAEGSASGVMGWSKFRNRDKTIKKTPKYVAQLAASADINHHYPYKFSVNVVQISQSINSRHRNAIKELLKRLPFKFSETKYGFICRNKGFHEFMFKFGNKYGKHVPKWIKELPPEYLKNFVDWAIVGDGCIRKNGGKHYITTSKVLADDMQELFLKLGTSASILSIPACKAKIKGKTYQKAKTFCVNTRKRDWKGVGTPTLLRYKGLVYCATVPNSTLYVRRKGISSWCGNSTIRVFPDWSESTPDRPRYAQMTGLKGERGIVAFLDKELIYIKQNNRNSTPFGLGCLEVAFNTLNFHLGAMDAAGRAGADQVHKTMLWWAPAQTSSNMFAVRKHIQNELEGQAKIGLISGMMKPEIVDINAVKPEDLLLEWQIFLIKVIAQAFDISPIALGIDQHSNRSTSQVMSDADWRSGIVPRARTIEEAITSEILHKFMGWKDLEFAWIGLEDPDALTKVSIQQRYYMMNVYTPDDVRKDLGMPPLPAGWGRLTSGQLSLLVMQAQAKLGIKGGGSSSGIGSMGTSTGAGSTTGGGGFGGGTIGAAGWSASDIAMMSPDDIQQFQEAGLLPPTGELGQQMEQEDPGILETLSFELRDFFDIQEQLEDEAEVQPDDPTVADEKGQQKRYQDSQHEPLWRERVIWDRKSGDKLPNREAEPGRVTLDYSPRGKYPRSGGSSSKKKGAKNLYK